MMTVFSHFGQRYARATAKVDFAQVARPVSRRHACPAGTDGGRKHPASTPPGADLLGRDRLAGLAEPRRTTHRGGRLGSPAAQRRRQRRPAGPWPGQGPAGSPGSSAITAARPGPRPREGGARPVSKMNPARYRPASRSPRAAEDGAALAGQGLGQRDRADDVGLGGDARGVRRCRGRRARARRRRAPRPARAARHAGRARRRAARRPGASPPSTENTASLITIGGPSSRVASARLDRAGVAVRGDLEPDATAPPYPPGGTRRSARRGCPRRRRAGRRRRRVRGVPPAASAVTTVRLAR
jgi:hypothetical protein